MTLRWYYSVDATTVLEITNRVRLPVDPEGVSIDIGQHADAGSGWEGDLLVDDPSGDLIMLGYRRIYCVQDAAPAGNQVVGNWFISNIRVRRMDPWQGAARTYVVTMADENSLFNRRKFVGSDANRPEETDIERIEWFLTTTEGNVFSPELTYIDTDGPVTVDKTDLRTQSPEDMMMSLSQASAESASGPKSYWCKYEEAAAIGGAIVSSSIANPSVITTTTPHGLTTGQSVTIAGHTGSTPSINGTHVVTVTGASTYTIPVNVTTGGSGGTSSTVGRYLICYFNMNTSDLYTSTISLSNDPADIDIAGLIYPLSDDAELDRAYGRMASRLVGQYKAGWIESPEDTTTGDTYAYVERTVPIPNTETEAKALAQITAQQAELTVPDDETTTVWNVLDPAHMNLLMHGMRVPVKALHFPNYTEDDTRPGYATGFVYHRVMQRNIGQQGPTSFPMPLRLSPQTVPCTPPDTHQFNGMQTFDGFMFEIANIDATPIDSGSRNEQSASGTQDTVDLVGAGLLMAAFVYDAELTGDPPWGIPTSGDLTDDYINATGSAPEYFIGHALVGSGTNSGNVSYSPRPNDYGGWASSAAVFPARGGTPTIIQTVHTYSAGDTLTIALPSPAQPGSVLVIFLTERNRPGTFVQPTMTAITAGWTGLDEAKTPTVSGPVSRQLRMMWYEAVCE